MNVKKEKFYQYSLIIIGLFWVLFGYIHLKYHIVHRIWAVIDAPYNYYALPEFFSYDALPILAVIFTGASFVLYSSILLKNVTKKSLKWLVYIILWLIIFAGCLRFVPIVIKLFCLIIGLGEFGPLGYRDTIIYRTFYIYLLPLLIICSGIVLLELVRLKRISKTENAEIHCNANRMKLLPITAFLWISAGIVNLVTKLKMVNRTVYSWQIDGSFMKTVIGIANEFVMEQVFYILVGLLLFIIWIWCKRNCC